MDKRKHIRKKDFELMYKLGHLESNGQSQDASQCNNKDVFTGHNVNNSSCNLSSPPSETTPKSSTTSVLRRWRRPESHDSKNVQSKELPAIQPPPDKQMNQVGNYTSGEHTTTADFSLYVPQLSPLVPQSTARPYDSKYLAQYGENKDKTQNYYPENSNQEVHFRSPSYPVQNTPPLAHTSSQKYSYPNRDYSVVAHNFSPQKINPQEDPNYCLTKPGFDNRISPQNMTQTPHNPKSPIYRNFPQNVQQNYVPSTKSSEFQNNYYIDKPPCNQKQVIDSRYQNYTQNYIKNAVQDPKLTRDYRSVVNNSKKSSPPFPILEQRLNQTEPSYCAEYPGQGYYPPKYGPVMLSRTSPGHNYPKIPPQEMIIPPSYPFPNKYYPQNQNQEWKMPKEYEQNLYLSQMNQMHARLPHPKPDLPRDLSYVDQNQRLVQKSRMYCSDTNPVEHLQYPGKSITQKSPKMVGFNTPENIYLNLSRSCASVVKQKIDYNPVIHKTAELSRDYFCSEQQNYVCSPPLLGPNSRNPPPYPVGYPRQPNIKINEIPPRNISPRRTFQENMPVVVYSPQHVGISKSSPTQIYPPEYSNPQHYPGYYPREFYPGVKPGMPQYSTDQTRKYPNIPQQRFHFGYPDQYYQHKIPECAEKLNYYQGNMYRGHYNPNLHEHLQQNAGRNFEEDYRKAASNYNDFEAARTDDRSVYCKKDSDIGKSLKEFLESWEDDEEIVANLPDLVLCNNILPDKQKLPFGHSEDTSETSKSSSDEEIPKESEEQPLYILGTTNISSEALPQYLAVYEQVDRLPDNIKGFYKDPATNTGETPPVTDIKDAPAESIRASLSPHDLTINKNKEKNKIDKTEEVLNLSTNRNKENNEFLVEEYSNHSEDDTKIEENTQDKIIDEEMSEDVKKKVEMIKDFIEEVKKNETCDEEKCFIVVPLRKREKNSNNEIKTDEIKSKIQSTTSVIVPNTFFETNKTDDTIKKDDEMSETNNSENNKESIDNKLDLDVIDFETTDLLPINNFETEKPAKEIDNVIEPMSFENLINSPENIEMKADDCIVDEFETFTNNKSVVETKNETITSNIIPELSENILQTNNNSIVEQNNQDIVEINDKKSELIENISKTVIPEEHIELLNIKSNIIPELSENILQTKNDSIVEQNNQNIVEINDKKSELIEDISETVIPEKHIELLNIKSNIIPELSENILQTKNDSIVEQNNRNIVEINDKKFELIEDISETVIPEKHIELLNIKSNIIPELSENILQTKNDSIVEQNNQDIVEINDKNDTKIHENVIPEEQIELLNKTEETLQQINKNNIEISEIKNEMETDINDTETNIEEEEESLEIQNNEILSKNYDIKEDSLEIESSPINYSNEIEDLATIDSEESNIEPILNYIKEGEKEIKENTEVVEEMEHVAQEINVIEFPNEEKANFESTVDKLIITNVETIQDDSNDTEENSDIQKTGNNKTEEENQEYAHLVGIEEETPENEENPETKNTKKENNNFDFSYLESCTDNICEKTENTSVVPENISPDSENQEICNNLKSILDSSESETEKIEDEKDLITEEVVASAETETITNYEPDYEKENVEVHAEISIETEEKCPTETKKQIVISEVESNLTESVIVTENISSEENIILPEDSECVVIYGEDEQYLIIQNETNEIDPSTEIIVQESEIIIPELPEPENEEILVEQIPTDPLGEEIIICEEGLEDWVQNEEIIEEEDKENEELSENDEDMKQIVEKFISEEKKSSNFEKKSNICEERRSSVEEKELFINPENPVSLSDNSYPFLESTPVLKRRVSYEPFPSPKIDFKAPKRRYSTLDVGRIVKKPLINLDEISKNITEVLENLTKQETQYAKENNEKIDKLQEIREVIQLELNKIEEEENISKINADNFDIPPLEQEEIVETEIKLVDSSDNVTKLVEQLIKPKLVIPKSNFILKRRPSLLKTPEIQEENPEIVNTTRLTEPIFPKASIPELKTTKNVDPRIDRPKEIEKDEKPSLIENKLCNTFSLTEYTKNYIKMKTGQTVDPKNICGINGYKKIDPRSNNDNQMEEKSPKKDCKNEKKIKINLQDYRNRKQSQSSDTVSDNSLSSPKLEESKSKNKAERKLYHNDTKSLNENIPDRKVEKLIIKPKKSLESSKDLLIPEVSSSEEPKFNPTNKLDCKDLKQMRPKKRKRRFRNLYTIDEETEEDVQTKQLRISLEANEDSTSSKMSEDSQSTANSSNGDLLCCLDLSSNGTSETDCAYKCHIKIDSEEKNIGDYEINKNSCSNSNKLKLTLKPVKKKKPAFSEVLSNLDSLVESEILSKRIKKKVQGNKSENKSDGTLWTIKNKVPKVIIKRNGSGYCAVFRDVSSNPIWQPKIRLKRQKYIESLVLRSKC